MSKLLILTTFYFHLITSVIFRYQPPFSFRNPQQPIQAEKTNLIRRRFKNEAPIQTSTISFCLDYNFTDKLCSKCYDGFLLENNSCTVDPKFTLENKWKQLSFMKISTPYPVNKDMDKILFNINPFCSSLTSDRALCLSCYKTHKLQNGNCIEKEEDLNPAVQLYLRPLQAPKNIFCKTFDSEGNCTSCIPESTFNGSQCVLIQRPDLDCHLHNFCVPKSTECESYSTEGLCKSCPFDAININGVCRINRPESLCVEIEKDGTCKRCSSFGYLNEKKVCKFKSPNCMEYNSDNYTCNVCLPTYRRENGECIRVAKIMFINTDPNCATWKKGLCIQCKFGFGFYEKYCYSLAELDSKGIVATDSREI